MIFEKVPLPGTRVSFETGLFQLDGHALFLSSRDIQLERGESIKATARVLSRYVDGIMIRTFAQSDVEQLAEFASVPVINGLTDYCHPCQVFRISEGGGGEQRRVERLILVYCRKGQNGAHTIAGGRATRGNTGVGGHAGRLSATRRRWQ